MICEVARAGDATVAVGKAGIVPDGTKNVVVRTCVPVETVLVMTAVDVEVRTVVIVVANLVFG